MEWSGGNFGSATFLPGWTHGRTDVQRTDTEIDGRTNKNTQQILEKIHFKNHKKPKFHSEIFFYK